jgi:hypothetical protein
MPESDPLSPADLRQLNALILSFSITGVQAISLYRLSGGSWPQAQAALIRTEMAGEDVYAGALRRLSEEAKCAAC